METALNILALFASNVHVKITATLTREQQPPACHGSPCVFWRAQQEIPNTLKVVREMAERAGNKLYFEKAEGLRQRLDQGFPQDSLLGDDPGEWGRTVAS
jgi:hypothetical protein